MDFLGKGCFQLLLMLSHLLGESQAIRWVGSLQNHEVIHPCKNSNVTLPWRYELEENDTVTDIEWYYEGKSQEGISILINGHFLPYPAFSDRVTLTDNAGLTLTGLLPGDSGNYSVIVKGHRGSDRYFELKKTVTLRVSGHTMNHNGSLLVSQSVQPVMDTTSGQWAIQLVCGHFSFNGQPANDVLWISPDNIHHNSSSFDGVNFNLLLNSPILGGSYTCRLPRQYSCSSGNGLVAAEASITVDAVNARLTLLERTSVAEMQELKAQKELLEQKLNHTDSRLENVTGELHRVSQGNADLRQLNGSIGDLNAVIERQRLKQSDTERRLDLVLAENRHFEQLVQHLNESVVQLKQIIEKEQLSQNQTARELASVRGLTRQLTDSDQQLFQQNVQLQQQLNAATAQLNQLEAERGSNNNNNKTVSFHARYWNGHNDYNGTGGRADPMVFTQVLTNEGNGYNGTTGLFTAPYPGVYTFFGKTKPEDGPGWVNLYIYTRPGSRSTSSFEVLVDYVSVYMADPPAPVSSSPMAAVQAVIRLDEGDVVSLVCRWDYTTKPYLYNTMFSGFSVSLD